MKANYKVIIVTDHSNGLDFLTVSEVKKFLRISFSEDDDLLQDMIFAVCERAEHFLGFHLLKRKVVQTNYEIYGTRIELQQLPLIKINQVTIKVGNEVESLTDNDYEIDSRKQYLLFSKEINNSSLKIQYFSGYTKESLPSVIKQGMLCHIAHLYDGKDDRIPVPTGAIDLYSSCRYNKVWR